MKYLALAVLLAVVQTTPPIPRQASNSATGAGSAIQKQSKAKKTIATQTPLPANAGQTPEHDATGNGQGTNNAEHSVSVTKLPPVTITSPKRDWADWGVWGFTFLLAITSVLQIWLLRRTLRYVRRQAHEMTKQRHEMWEQRKVMAGQLEAMQSQITQMESAGKQTDKIIEQATIQANHMAITANAAKDSAEIATRNTQAFINKERPLLIIEGTITPDFEAHFSVSNKGRSPARLIYSFVGCEIYNSEEEFAKRAPNPDYTMGDPEWVFGRNDWLLPGASIEVGDYSADYISSENPDLLANVMGLKERVWYYGVIRYIDGLTEEECETRFCYHCSPMESGRHLLFEGGPPAYLGEKRSRKDNQTPN